MRRLILAAAVAHAAAARSAPPPPLPILEAPPATAAGRTEFMEMADGLVWDASVAVLCGKRRMEWAAALQTYVRAASANPRLNLGAGWTDPDQRDARAREFAALEEGLVSQHREQPQRFCADYPPRIQFARDDALVQRLHPAPFKPGEGLFQP